MPATKRSVANKNGRLRTSFGRLMPNSPAKKLVAFVLLFAVLGGGYYAYRSFAATSVKTYYASDFSSARNATKRRDSKAGNLFTTVITMVAPSDNQRVGINTSTKETFKGTYKACFYYRVPEQRGRPAKATMAFAVFDNPAMSKSLAGKSKELTTSSGYKAECLSFEAPTSKKLTIAVGTWKGAASFSKVTIAPEKTVTVTAKNLSTYSSQTSGIRNVRQSGGAHNGKTVMEMYKPGSRILIGLKKYELNKKVPIAKGKRYEACITYSIGDRGSASDLVTYYPVGKTKVDQQNYDTTKSLSKYTTKCHAFTYNEGNADAVSLHYPSWAQRLSKPYKIRVQSIKITQL